MTTQPTFFGTADTATVQRGLFDQSAADSGLTCCQCGRRMLETASGFIACEAGCGRLHLAETVTGPESGLWFDDTEGEG